MCTLSTGAECLRPVIQGNNIKILATAKRYSLHPTPSYGPVAPPLTPSREKSNCFSWMLILKYSPAILIQRIEFPKLHRNAVVCAAKGPRPRYPRVWKTKKRIGTISKSLKLVECIKGLSNVKEEVYGALDSFIAWELEFPLVTVKKALKTLENEKEWKRIIQASKWMLSKGQGRTMGTYYTMLNALAEDGRLDEAEELWTKLFSENLDSTPRMFFEKMISIYYHREMHEKMFEVFADMEELGMRPTVPIVKMVGDVFQKLDMIDKYQKLNKKYPPPKWEYRYIKGKRVKIRAQDRHNSNDSTSVSKSDKDANPVSYESVESADISSYKRDTVEDYQSQPINASPIVSVETIDSSVVA